MKVNITKYLTDEERMIRELVFVKEQGFQNEFDSVDEIAWHLVLYDKETPVACCRFFLGEKESEYIIGRIAVLKTYRGKGLGAQMVLAVETYLRKIGGKVLRLSAQVRVKSFYEKIGFGAIGEIYLDEYCEHIWMEKVI